MTTERESRGTARGGDALTTIPLKKATRDRLKLYGAKGETYDIVLNRILDALAAPPPTGKPPEDPSRAVDFEAVDSP